MLKSKKDYFLLYLKGMGMGAADVVPGVSGGTIALISGIYEEFIEALKSFSGAPKALKNGGLKGAWLHINGKFLITLASGIVTSLLTLVFFIKYALENHPIAIWSFFFGLIIASCYFVGKTVNIWSLANIISLLVGTILIFLITSIAPSQTSTELWMVFIAGTVAICAMILPGISGAFILVLIGQYKYIISSLSELNIVVVGTFALGCISGLLLFSHFLSWLLKKYHNLTLALLTGFMIGSLNKIWPWKETLSWTTDRHGETVPLLQNNVLPTNFSEGYPQLGLAIVFCILGFGLIFILEKMGDRIKSN